MSDAPETVDPREAALERLSAIRAELAELRQVRDQATIKMNRLLDEEAALITKYEGTEINGPYENQKAIMAHLQRQNEARQARAQRRSAALATGVSSEDLRGTSAIDAAHARRSGFGTKRPNYGPKAQ